MLKSLKINLVLDFRGLWLPTSSLPDKKYEKLFGINPIKEV